MQFCRSQNEAAARTAESNISIGSGDIWALRLLIPLLLVQKAMMDRMQSGFAEIAALKVEAQASYEAAKVEVGSMILGAKTA